MMMMHGLTKFKYLNLQHVSA